MKLTDPYFLIGLVVLLVGVVLYFYPVGMLAFTMYGLPMTTIVLAIIGLVLMFLGIRK